MIPEDITISNVDHPGHYDRGGFECINIIQATLGSDLFLGYLWGNVLKYLFRWRDKNGVEDLKKARKYLDWMIEGECDDPF